MAWHGNYTEDASLTFKFHTNDATGALATLSGTPSLAVYVEGSTTQSTAGITLTADYDSVTGLNNVTIDLSADAFYAVNKDYDVVIAAGTVDGVSVVGCVVGSFSIEKRFNEVDVTKWLGTAVATPETAGIPSVDIVTVNGDAQTNDLDAIFNSLDGGPGSVHDDIDALSVAVGTIDTKVDANGAAIAGVPTNAEFEARTLLAASYATSAEVTSIQNNTRVVRVVPTVIERPDSGTTTYRIELLLYDTVGNMEVPDSAPTIALVDQGGTDLSARLDSATMALVSTGRYRAVYTASDTDDLEQLIWAFSVIEGGNTRIYGNTTIIVDTTAVDFTSSDRTLLQAAATETTALAVKAKTDLIPASPAAVGSAMTLTSGERNSIADAHLDRANGVETGLTPRELQRLIFAAIVGESDGHAASGDVTGAHFLNLAGDKNRITVNYDSNGNRTSVTLDLT